jgi:DNA-directed RNA polymerase subunit alpha
MICASRFRVKACTGQGWSIIKLVFFFGRESMTRIPLSAVEEQRRSLQQRLELSTAEIGLTVRTTNCLEEKGIFSVKDLLQATPADLLSISNFGGKTLEEVYDALEAIGFFRNNSAVAV